MSINKRKFSAVLEASILNRSGYGIASDMIARAIINYEHFHTTIIPTLWGTNVPRLIENKDDQLIMSKIPKIKEIPQPQIYLCNTIPYLSNRKGTIFNVNFCAGLEVDQCPDRFIQGVNQWDLNIVCSNYAKEGYFNSKIKPTSPIEVLNYGIDTSIYKITSELNSNVEQCMESITEEECFLFVGQVTSKHLFGDRKDVSNLIKTFCETFRGKSKKPALILKISGTSYSPIDRNLMLDRIKMVKSMVENNDVNVYLIHGELSDSEMNALMNHKKVIAHISFTHSEGYGLPLIQGSLSGKPVIVSNYSGHLDFLPQDMFIPLEGKLDVIPPYCESEFFQKDSKWFYVDYNKASNTLSQFFYGNRDDINAKANQLAIDNANKFNLKKFEYRLHRILDKYLGLK